MTLAAGAGETFADIVTDGPLLVAALVAALVGLISFLSPCVLPLVPGYLSYVTGLSGVDAAATRPERDGDAQVGGTAVLTAAPARTRVVAGAGLFVLGFTAVFVAYGVLFGRLGALLMEHQRTLERVLGVVVVLLGLAFLGVLPGLSRDLRIHRLPATGLAGAPLLGVVFGLGLDAVHRPDARRGAVAGVVAGRRGPRRAPLGGVLPGSRRPVRAGRARHPVADRRARRGPPARGHGDVRRGRAAGAARPAAADRALGRADDRAPVLGRRDRDRDVTVTATPDTPVRPDDPGAVAVADVQPAELSTQPEPVRPGPAGSMLAATRNGWRRLTSMRTALVLLFLLALASVPGSLLPQRPLNPIKVDSYIADHPQLARVLDAAGLLRRLRRALVRRDLPAAVHLAARLRAAPAAAARQGDAQPAAGGTAAAGAAA